MISLETSFSGDESFGSYLSDWLEGIVKQRVRPSTFERYYERIYGYIIPALGQIPVSMLTGEQVQKFVDRLSEKGLSSSTVINVAKLLRVSMKEACNLGLIGNNPCKDLVMPVRNDKEAPVLTKQDQDELELIIANTDPCLELSVLLTLYAGLSTGEVCALKWRDVDFTIGMLTIRGILQRVKVFEEDGSKTVLMENTQKGKRSVRRIPLSSGLLDKLKTYGGSMSTDFYVLTCNRKPIEPRTLRIRFDKAVLTSGLSVTYQTLRRTYIMRCLEYDCEAETLSRILGHANVNTTLNMRVYNTYEREKQIMEQVWMKNGH